MQLLQFSYSALFSHIYLQHAACGNKISMIQWFFIQHTSDVTAVV